MFLRRKKIPMIDSLRKGDYLLNKNISESNYWVKPNSITRKYECGILRIDMELRNLNLAESN